jgi:hypothetical protein
VSLTLARSIQSTSCHHISLGSILIIFCVYYYVLQIVCFPQVSSPSQCMPLSCPIRTTWRSHLIFLDLTTRIIHHVVYISWSFSLWNFFKSPRHLFPLRTNIFLSILFSKTVALYFSLNVTKFHVHTKQQENLLFCLIWSLHFSIEKWKLNSSWPNSSKNWNK